MKILLVGYGKMGQTIEKIAQNRGNEIVGRIDKNELDNLSSYNASNVDVAIEFTEPTAAFNNITTCIKNGIPVVSGTTGWLERRGEVEALCKEKEGAFFYASNYSVGVNIFFKLNEFLAKMMNPYKEYDVEVSEIHHIHKKDAPSGTALTLTEGVLKNIDQKSSWVLEEGESVEAKSEELKIKAFREEEVPGTHSIHFNSEIDSIEIKHVAHSRQGFALGAVLAAEWIAGKQGVFGMDDLLGFK